MADVTGRRDTSHEDVAARSQAYERGAAGLVAAVHQLSLARDLATVQQIVRRAARALIGADGATFVLREGDLCFYADEDAIAPLWKGERFSLEACISGWSMVHRHSVAIEDIYTDDRIPQDAYRATFVKSLVMVPIRSADPLGAIGIYWAQRHAATAQEIELLEALADSTALAMEHVSLLADLDQPEPTLRRIVASDIPAWADVFDRLPVGVIAIDAAGTVVYWSAHAERLYGWRKSEMLGRDIRELTAGSEEAEHAEEILAQVAAGEAWEGEFAARRKDGSKLLVRIVDAPLFDEGGDVVGMIGVSVGLDRLYEAERREKLEALEQAMSRISSFVAGLSVGDDADRPELDALTPRQREVVTLLQRGLRVRTIADRLGISESTARNHLGVVYRRLGVRSQRELLELLSEPPRP